MNENTTPKQTQNREAGPTTGRVVGLDAHPDTFTSAIIAGCRPVEAIVEQMFNRVPMDQLAAWAKKHTREEDLIVLEASGNSFQVVRVLQGAGRKAKVLESAQMGRLKEAHANNDKISAVRIGKAYLAGTAKEVWLPDPLTQERRDWMHAHRKAVKRCTQMTNRMTSYLSDNGVRVTQDLRLDDAQSVRQAKAWSPRQWSVLEIFITELRHAQEQRANWVSLLAREVLADPVLLSLTRRCGIRDITAFAIGAVIGDIRRFTEPKKLVKYVGLNPAFDDSGESQWSGGLTGHGRSDLRALLIESAQAILRTKDPLGRWGRKLLAARGQYNLAVAAVARKLVVSIWYLLMGRDKPVEKIEPAMAVKVGKMISHVGQTGLKALGQRRADLRTKAYELILRGRVYQIPIPNKPAIQATPKSKPAEAPVSENSPPPRGRSTTIAQEYGLE